MDLTTVKTSHHVRLQAVFQYMSWSKYTMRRASLKGLTVQGSRLLKELAVRCKALHTLELYCGGSLYQSLLDAVDRASNLRNLVLGSQVVLEAAIVHRIMDLAPNLVVARFGVVVTRPNSYGWNMAEWKLPDHVNLREFSISQLQHAGTRALILVRILMVGSFRLIQRSSCDAVLTTLIG